MELYHAGDSETCVLCVGIMLTVEARVLCMLPIRYSLIPRLRTRYEGSREVVYTVSNVVKYENQSSKNDPDRFTFR